MCHASLGYSRLHGGPQVCMSTPLIQMEIWSTKRPWGLDNIHIKDIGTNIEL
jgi:hypothetical protein